MRFLESQRSVSVDLSVQQDYLFCFVEFLSQDLELQQSSTQETSAGCPDPLQRTTNSSLMSSENSTLFMNIYIYQKKKKLTVIISQHWIFTYKINVFKLQIDMNKLNKVYSLFIPNMWAKKTFEMFVNIFLSRNLSKDISVVYRILSWWGWHWSHFLWKS